jgi:hypothetical protein
MVSMLASGAVDHKFIGGVMVSMLASGAVDHGFIGGVMVNFTGKYSILSTRHNSRFKSRFTFRKHWFCYKINVIVMLK